MDFKEKFKRNKGITLIALVVTIVVLLILAGISISMLTGQNGILNRGTEAKAKTAEAQNQEELELGLSNLMMDYQLDVGGTTSFTDYIFSHEDKVKSVLGASNVSLDNTAKTINYKGTLYTLSNDGKVTRLDGIGLSESTKTLSIVKTEKQEFTLTATLTNISGTIAWTSSNTNVATVTGNGRTGTVKAVGDGTTTIKATCNGKEATCEVTVTTINVATSLNITGKTEVAAGGKIELTVTQSNSTNNANDIIEWTSSDGSKATVTKVDNTKAIVKGIEKADSITITATAKNSNINQTHTIKVTEPDLASYSWEQIGKAAKVIAESSDDYSNGTASVEIEENGKKLPVTIKVGQTTDIKIGEKKYTVRVLDFKHDDLATGVSYGASSTATKAGISFEFVTSLGSAKMRDTSTNNGGWGASNIQKNLNSTEAAQDGSINLANIEEAIGSNLIKKVKKKYIDQKGNAYSSSGSELKESEDYLWLLSCSEVWSDGAQYTNGSWVTTEGCYGKAGTSEGSQYKYYASIKGLTYANSNSKLVKYNTNNSSVWWWLRSPYSNNFDYFCGVTSYGSCDSYYAYYSGAVAPGFAI